MPRWVPILLLLVAFAAFAAAGGLDLVTADRAIQSYHALRSLVAAHPVTALIAFILGYAALISMVIFPAAFVLTITGGLLFGAVLGTAASVVGVTAGGVVSFLAARHAFAPRVARWLGKTGLALAEALRRDGLLYLMVLRTTPGLPFFITTLAAAAAGFRLRPFVIGTGLGVIPQTAILANLGAGAAAVLDRGGKLSAATLFDPSVLWPVAVLAGFGVAGILLKAWTRRRAGLPAREGTG